jgi:hypothetical protein
MLLVAFFTVAGWSVATPQPPNQISQRATENRSVSGKISSIGDATFSVDVKHNQDLVTMRFLIDDTTRIEGRFEVGLVANVAYRTDGDNNIAVNVRVQAALDSYLR